MKKGVADRGVRREESGVRRDIPLTDSTSGDEGIDDHLDEKRGSTTALPLPEKPEAHQSGADRTSRSVSVEQDRNLREGRYSDARFNDGRMKDLPDEPESGSGGNETD
jgi:hypothetical protein